MKKAAVCLLLLFTFLSILSASSEWAISRCIDDFGDETEDIYLSSGMQTGTYTDDHDMDSPLKWQLIIKENAVSFKLTKNENQIVRYNSTNDEYTGSFYVVLRDDYKNDYDFAAYIDGFEICFIETEATSLLRLLAINKTPRIIIYETEWLSSEVRNIFKLGVVNTDGFSELYNETYGVDWSQPLSIELFPEEKKVLTYSDEVSSIGVSVSLGSQKIYCPYQTSFAGELQCDIDDDYGFIGYKSHLNSDGNIDYSNIYLHHITELTNERSGYITVQLGEVTEKCLVEVVTRGPVQEEPMQTVEIPEEASDLTVTEAQDLSASSEIIEPIVDKPEDYALAEFYRNGRLLIAAELKNTSAEVKLNIEDDEILELITWLAEKYPEYTAGVSYTLKDSILNVSYPEMTEDEADNTWRLLKFALDTYCLTLEENTNAEAESEAAETPAAEDIESPETEDAKEVRIPDGSDEEKIETSVQAVVEKKAETVSVKKTIIERPFKLRARLEGRVSIGYTGKTIEGTNQITTKTGQNENHALVNLMLESKFFVTNNLYLSVSVGPCGYAYSFTDHINTIYNKTESSYSAVIFGASAEVGVGYQKGGIYGEIRLGVVKTFKSEYNENTNITLTGIFGLYVVEMGFGLDYNIEENRIRPQVLFAYSIPICHVTNENGEKQWHAFGF